MEFPSKRGRHASDEVLKPTQGPPRPQHCRIDTHKHDFLGHIRDKGAPVAGAVVIAKLPQLSRDSLGTLGDRADRRIDSKLWSWLALEGHMGLVHRFLEVLPARRWLTSSIEHDSGCRLD